MERWKVLIPQTRKISFLLLLGFLFVTSTFVGIFLQITGGNHQLVREPFHSSMEGIGAVLAILMALLLLHVYRDNEKQQGEYFLLSMGFFMMGLLDGLHSIAKLHHGFILLRSLANISSGFWFVLVWLPGTGKYLSRIKAFPWLIVSVSLLLGVMTIQFRESFPFMIENQKFTFEAIFVNLLAGIFAIVTGIFYLRRFFHSSTTESYLFASMFLLLGLSGIAFPISGLWTHLWWFWHAERFLAYIVVLVYMIRLFLWKSHELKKMNEVLEERIKERTKELVNEVAERTRYALERDKVILDLQDAQNQIKTLTGLLPICASCKKIRNTEGDWEQLEAYIHEHSGADFTHSICPQCVKKIYPDLDINIELYQKKAV